MKRLSFAAFLIALAMMLSANIFAKNKTQQVDLSQATQVGATTLPPGTYQVRANDNGTVTFSQKGKQVAEVAGQTVQLPRKSQNTSVTVDHSSSVPRIAEIDFEGSQTAIGFAAQPTAAAAGE